MNLKLRKKNVVLSFELIMKYLGGKKELRLSFYAMHFIRNTWPLWIPATVLNGPPCINKVYLTFTLETARNACRSDDVSQGVFNNFQDICQKIKVNKSS